jgi:hypothetical protein
MLNIFKTEKGTGALNDIRSTREKLRDYSFAEAVATIDPVPWKEKSESEWRMFPIYNQNGSGSCVAQTAAKLLGVSYWLKNKEYVHFSATSIYQQRVNKPSPGMMANDAFQIISKHGATLEVLTPSQDLTDQEMDETNIPEYKRAVGRVFSVPNYLAAPQANIEAIASIIQKTRKAVMVWFFFEASEWTDVPVVKNTNLNVLSSHALRHSVTAVDFTLYNGKKALIIEDSWGPGHGKGGRRIITEDFFLRRNYYAGYLMNFKFDTEAVVKPHHRFSTQLSYGQTNPEIRILQDMLKYEELFPANISSTGYYGGITAKGVLEFQKKYKVASLTELEALQGMVVGPKTIDKLNQLFG